MPKYPNIIGTGFPDFIQDQINTRSSIIGSTSRDGKKLSYLNNRTGWFRMTSAAIINGSDESAKNNILQGGIVSRNSNNTINLKSSFNEKYTKGNDDDLGLRPMPGITDLSIGTGGKWQTIQEAEVQFICYNLDQLNTISQLYMSLGVQVFIEYGHLPYYNNSSELISKIDTINFFDINQDPKGRESLIKQITKKEEDTNGNYGALLGYVFNFNYTSNPDGSYTCSSKVIGPGHLAESLTINNSTGFFIFNENEEEPTSEKNKSDLEHVLSKLKDFSEKRTDTSGTQSQGQEKNIKVLTYDTKKYGAPRLGVIGRELDVTYDTVLTGIYSNSQFCSGTKSKLSFTKKNFIINDNNLSFGNATQIVNGLAVNNDDLLPIPESNPQFFDLIHIKNDKKSYSYITLGHLFLLVQTFGVIVSEDENTSEIPLKLDFHPDNTIIKSGVIQATINPYVCAIPLNYTSNEQWANFFGGVVVNKPNLKGIILEDGKKFADRNNLDDIPPITKLLAKIVQIFTGKTNFEKNIATSSNVDKLSPIINYLPINDENNNIKIFNLLVNIEMVLDVFTFLSNQREDKKVFLLPFLNKILEKNKCFFRRSK